jgi:Protein of unknown function (DUF1565)
MRRRRFTFALAACIAAALLLLGWFISSPSSPTAAAPGVPARATARPALFLDPSGSDAAGCTRSAPCRTLERAYRRAKPGQVVEMAPGSYGEETINPAKRHRRGRPVVFQPAGGGQVSVKELTIDAGVRGITFIGLHFPNGWDVGPADDGTPARDISFVRTTGTVFSIENGKRIAVRGGSYGPSEDQPAQIKVYNPDDHYSPTDILVRGVLFHDFTRSSNEVHTECLQIYAGERLRIENNRFTNCSGTGSLALTTVGSSTLRHVLVQNNWFDGRGDAYYAIQSDLSVYQATLRYNSSVKSMAFTDCGSAKCQPSTVIANVMPWNPSLCASGVSYAYNVLQGGRCGRTDKRVHKLGFVDPGAFDLDLTPGSPARCAGDPQVIPGDDIDGQRRGRGRRPDAGADQSPLPGTATGRCRLG